MYSYLKCIIDVIHMHMDQSGLNALSVAVYLYYLAHVHQQTTSNLLNT